MIKVDNLVKKFDQQIVVDGISFSVNKGEVLGFLGPNGAGKSTTMKMITGFLSPSSGRVEVCGDDVESNPVQIKKSIGYLPEGAPAYSDMTPMTFLSFIAEIRGFHGEERQRKVDAAVKRTNLQSVVHKPIENLSKGFKRRVGLAQAILHDPPVLVMDEPTDGLDPNQKHEVRELIAEMSKEKAIIVSTHILEEVHAICSRVIIIAKGRVVFDGTPGELESKSRYHNSVVLRFSSAVPADVETKCKAIPGVADVELQAEGVILIPEKGISIVEGLNDLAREQSWHLKDFHVQKGFLDEVFRRVTIDAGAAKEEALS
ncbi:MAG: ABC transporter ATP-binding protein [Gammaproteobacteria bacterium]|nr:ABC transporter ATP-binding protein [Gammaproteobacteria bacterium]